MKENYIGNEKSKGIIKKFVLRMEKKIALGIRKKKKVISAFEFSSEHFPTESVNKTLP